MLRGRNTALKELRRINLPGPVECPSSSNSVVVLPVSVVVFVRVGLIQRVRACGFVQKCMPLGYVCIFSESLTVAVRRRLSGGRVVVSAVVIHDVWSRFEIMTLLPGWLRCCVLCVMTPGLSLGLGLADQASVLPALLSNTSVVVVGLMHYMQHQGGNLLCDVTVGSSMYRLLLSYVARCCMALRHT